MLWSKCLGPLKRHLAEFEAGNDFDFDPNCEGCKAGNCKNHLGKDVKHIDQVIWNAGAISSYYETFPQGDDRPHRYLKTPKIGLDIDEVLADWVGAWIEFHKISRPKCWFFDRDIMAKFNKMKKDNTLDSFYFNLKPLISPDEIPFEPHCYITSRPCSIETTEAWLDKFGFPSRPVYTVDVEQGTKIEVAKKSGIDIFVDDRYDNFVELNNSGICTFLMDAPHNQRYNVGYKRIKHLSQLV